MSKFDSIPSYEKARVQANLPLVLGVDDLLGKEIVVLEWAPDVRTVPQTRKETEGFEMEGAFVDTDTHFTCFIGGSVLIKELKALSPPFRTVIRRSGQTYRFS